MITCFLLGVIWPLNSTTLQITADDRQADVTALVSELNTDGDYPCVPVKIGNKYYWFILDTGANRTLIDTALTSELDELPTRQNVTLGTRTLEASSYKVDSLTLRGSHSGEFAIRIEEPVVSTDLTMIRALSARSVSGIIGMDILKNYVIH